jgi:hypothetical protein
MDLDAVSPSDVVTNGATVTSDVERSAAAQQLYHRLDTKQATIGVVGLGYVGLPLAVEYGGKGFSTVGIDLDEDRITQLNSGENFIDDLDDDRERVDAAGYSCQLRHLTEPGDARRTVGRLTPSRVGDVDERERVTQPDGEMDSTRAFRRVVG